jgi:hypothetical protein
MTRGCSMGCKNEELVSGYWVPATPWPEIGRLDLAWVMLQNSLLKPVLID